MAIEVLLMLLMQASKTVNDAAKPFATSIIAQNLLSAQNY
jgi:hypothetical protein